MCARYTWGLLIQKLNIIIFRASRPLHMCLVQVCTFSSPLYASIWLKFWPSWVAWLLFLCPMFPLVRLGHKGSTSAIVTAGSSKCVPHTGWSRKLAFLREYSVGGLKMFFTYHIMNPQMLCMLWFFQTQFGHAELMHAYPGKGTLSGTILSGRCFLQSKCNLT